MRKKRFIIFQCSQHTEDKVGNEPVHVHGEVTSSGKTHDIEFSLPYEQSANALMSAKGYVEYVKKHGYHFTEKLAEHVSKMLYNKIPQLQYIPESQISDLIETHKINLNKKATLGDMIYATNVAYSTFYPDLLKDMKACLIHAHKMVNSVNGYDGAIFCRWTADAIGKAIKIDWEKFI